MSPASSTSGPGCTDGTSAKGAIPRSRACWMASWPSDSLRASSTNRESWRSLVSRTGAPSAASWPTDGRGATWGSAPRGGSMGVSICRPTRGSITDGDTPLAPPSAGLSGDDVSSTPLRPASRRTSRGGLARPGSGAGAASRRSSRLKTSGAGAISRGVSRAGMTTGGTPSGADKPIS